MDAVYAHKKTFSAINTNLVEVIQHIFAYIVNNYDSMIRHLKIGVFYVIDTPVSIITYASIK